MKKTIICPCLLVLILFGFAACNDDDQNTPLTGLTGDYLLTETSGGFAGTGFPVDPVNDPQTLTIDQDSFRFFDNGTLQSSFAYVALPPTTNDVDYDLIITAPVDTVIPVLYYLNFSDDDSKITLDPGCCDQFVLTYTRQ